MLGLGEFSTTNDTNEGGDVLGDLNLARREKFSVFSFQFSVFSFQFSVFSFQFSVVSGQWSVVSGQWAVGSGQWAVVRGRGAVFCQREAKRNRGCFGSVFWLNVK